MSLKNIRL